MKVLFFSDLHNQERFFPILKKKSKEVDLIVCAGDASIFSFDLEHILKKLNGFGKQILMIHGNHEEPPHELKELCKKFKNIDFFHGEERLFNNLRFIGWGGGGFSKIDIGLELFLKKIRQERKEREKNGLLKHENIILVTHAPPRRTKLDKLWDHVGCQTIRTAIFQLNPILAVSGHIHDNAGVEDTLKNTRLINLGPEGIIINV